jgi:hypothetical protein
MLQSLQNLTGVVYIQKTLILFPLVVRKIDLLGKQCVGAL